MHSELPQLSVVIPLIDDRSQLFRCAEGWLRQRGASERFQILLVAANGEAPGRRLEGMLRAGDRIIPGPSSSSAEIGLYNLGAREARAEILLFTESHCVPEVDAVDGLLRRMADPHVSAIVLGSTDVSTNPISRMEGRIREERLRAHPDLGDWRHASLRGFAVRRSAFRAAGGFEEAFGRFAEAVLARRLTTLGHVVVGAPEVTVNHVNCTRFRDLAAALRAHGFGQAAFRERCEREGDEEILGRLGEWSNRAALRSGTAREMLAAAAKSLRGPAAGPFLAGILPRVPGLALGAFFGLRGAATASRFRSTWSAARCALLSFSEDRLYPAYVKLWTSYLRDGALDYIAARPSVFELAEPGSTRLVPGDMPDGALAGFHEAERVAGRSARWTTPLALVRLRLVPGDYRLVLSLWSPLPPGRAGLRLFFNGRRIREVCIEGERVSFSIGRGWFRASAEQSLVLTCAPYRPRDSGSDDPRVLGVLVFSFEFEALPRAATGRLTLEDATVRTYR